MRVVIRENEELGIDSSWLANLFKVRLLLGLKLFCTLF